MKRLIALLLAALMLVCSIVCAEETSPALTKNLVILFTSDVHAGIDQGWGYAGVAASVMAFRPTTMWCWWTTATPSRVRPSVP